MVIRIVSGSSAKARRRQPPACLNQDPAEAARISGSRGLGIGDSVTAVAWLVRGTCGGLTSAATAKRFRAGGKPQRRWRQKDIWTLAGRPLANVSLDTKEDLNESSEEVGWRGVRYGNTNDKSGKMEMEWIPIAIASAQCSLAEGVWNKDWQVPMYTFPRRSAGLNETNHASPAARNQGSMARKFRPFNSNLQHKLHSFNSASSNTRVRKQNSLLVWIGLDCPYTLLSSSRVDCKSR